VGALGKFSIGPSVSAIGTIGGTSREESFSQLITLGVPWHDIVEKPSLFSLLSWHTHISEFGGRDKEIYKLYQWATSTPRISVKFISGHGGTGKSRLAAEFAQKLKFYDWEAGFVNLRESRSFFLKRSGTLLIIDYPEENRAAVSELLWDLATIHGDIRIRVLFLTRQSIYEWTEVIHDNNAADVVEMEPLDLGGLNGQSAHQLYNSALEKSAEILGTCPPPLSEKALEDWLRQSPENDRALFILAAALHSSIHPEDDVVRYSGREVIEELSKREIDRLRGIARSRDASDQNVFCRVVAMAAIAGGIPVAYMNDLENIFNLNLGFRKDADIRTELRVAGLLSKNTIRSPEPDIVASAFTVAVLAQDEQTAPEFLWASLHRDIEFGLQQVARLSYDAEVLLGIHEFRISNWLARSLEKHRERCAHIEKFFNKGLPIGLIDAGVVVYRTLLDGVKDDGIKSRHLNNLSNHLGKSGDLPGALEAIREAVEIRRRLATTNPARYEPDLARSLNNLSNRLGESGDRQGALGAIRESVEIRRRLATSNPARYEPDLAGSLNNLSSHLGESGDRPGALGAIRESVEFYRRLATTNPARYEPDLAVGLNNLSNHLGESGDRQGALGAIREAVEIRRRLATTNPARYEPDLASSLNNLSSHLGESGDLPGALEAIREAVEFYRRLATAHPARYEPDLAGSLNNLSGHLGESGDRPGALEAIGEAVEFYRRLATTNPARYEPDLAGSLNNLSNHLSESGDRPGALGAIRESVEIRRRLATSNPARYEPDLALSLNNLSNHLGESGDRQGALGAIRESVEIRRRLATSNPARYEPDLAGSLNNQSNQLGESGDRQGALGAIHEAVEIRRRLATSNPARYEPDLAGSLNNLSNRLSESGDRPGALEAIREAVEIRRRLATSNPARYEPDLAGSLNNLSNRLSESGDLPGALEAIREAVEIRRRLEERSP
jgi:hypothetical protein